MGAFLMQRAGLVICPRGCVQLNLAAESLSLGDLRARLSQVYEVRSGWLVGRGRGGFSWWLHACGVCACCVHACMHACSLDGFPAS